MKTLNNVVNEYDKQAAYFLTNNGIKLTFKYIGKTRHFADDVKPRDTYNVTFSRDGKQFSVRFGDSIQNTDSDNEKSIRAYDVLASLQKYDVGSFEDFCGDFGYDTDSRTAERIYKAVCKEWEKVSRFFTSDEIEQLQEIQ